MYIHTGITIVLTTTETFRSEIVKKKKKTNSVSQCSKDSASLYKMRIESLKARFQQKQWNATSTALFECF
jgi:hypothetical protein